MIKKSILDAACGGKMFYFNKNDPRVLFGDIRKIKTKLCDGRDFEIAPDMIVDFTNMPFPDESFYLAVFDPPHLLKAGNGYQTIKYGKLQDDWRDTLRKGFAEYFRILKPNGTLIFKWNETDIPVKEILALTPYKPIMGVRCGKRMLTHYITFFKDKK
jgi:SAM-dependent methyltransferase